MFEMPTLLPLDPIEDISRRPEIKGLFCYVFKDYKPGKSVLIARKEGNVGIKVGDWSGNQCSLDESKVILALCPALLEVMKVAGIPQAQFFLSDDLKLVDVQVSLNKFLGPGFVRDLFSKVIPIQEQLEITVLTPDKLKEIKANKTRVILKPSRFRFITRNDKIQPLYAALG